MATERALDYSDLAAIPEPQDGKRHEILGGQLFVTASPTPAHQWVSRRLQRQLEDYFEGRQQAIVFNAPIDVLLATHDVVVPDLVVVQKAQISDRGIEGSPLLIVEILSPSTRARDRGLKARSYAALGVRHYWIVDPKAHRIDCYRAVGAAYEHVATAAGDATLEPPDWPDLTIDLATLWL